MKLKIVQNVTLTLQQKTDSSIETTASFKTNQVIYVDEVVPTNDNSVDWFDIVFPRESGWIAEGVHRAVFEVV